MRTARALVIAMLAACASSLAASGAAQAEPYWSIAGSKLATGSTETIFGTSGVSRLWSTGLGIVIVCKKDKVKGGELKGGEPGTDKAESVKFEECALYAATKASGKWEVGSKLGACSLKSPGAVIGEVVTGELDSTLAYYPGGGTEYTVEYLTPKEGEAFVEIEIEGVLCAVKQTAKVGGSVIGGLYPHGGLEAPTGYVAFTVHEGAGSEMINTPEEYENEKEETFADTLEFANKPAGYESMEARELESGKSFGVCP